MADITVYGAPWCPDCRRSKRFLDEQRVAYDWIDIDERLESAALVRELNGGSQIIPTIVFPDGTFLTEPTNAELAEKIGIQLRASKDAYDVVVIGGGPTGLSAAIYGAREGLESLVIDRSALGGQAGVTERIDNYPGFPDGIGGSELAGKLVAHARRYGVEMVQAVEVVALDPDGDGIVVRTRAGDGYRAKAVIVATGTSYRRLGVSGEGDLIGSGVHFCATCDGPFYQGAQELLVVGGGNSGVEEGLFLAQFADRVRLIEYMPELKASALLQEKIRNDPRFIIQTNTEILELRKGQDGRLGTVVARDRATGETRELTPAGVFVFIGLDPNTAFVKGVLELDGFGFVVTDDGFRTSVPGVFAAGDVRAGSTKQLGAATGEGISALLRVRDHLRELEAAVPTASGRLERAAKARCAVRLESTPARPRPKKKHEYRGTAGT
jgi:thioredoxin reductase (NADPH)